MRLKFQAPFLSFILLFIFKSAFSQDIAISYINPQSLNVCDSAKFEVILAADADVENLTVEVWFPKGISYTAGSVENASEENISNLQRPVFRLPNLPGGEEIAFTIWAFGDCALVSSINSGKLFANTITANYDSGSDLIITQPYRVETGFLVIKDIVPETVSGTLGNTVTRSIIIKNTRLGKISSFTFRDSHEGGFSITTNGENPMQTATSYSAVFDASHFRTIGNNDDFFDEGEEIIIREEIYIDQCGLYVFQSNSVLSAEWGCNNEVCQSTSRLSTVNFEEYTKKAELEFTAETEIPPNFCIDRVYYEKLTVRNDGNASTDSLLLILFPADSGVTNFIAGMNVSTLTIDSAGNTIPFEIISQENITLNDCPDITNAFANIRLRLRNLAPGEEITLSWESRVCRTDCSSQVPKLSYGYEYRKICPKHQLVTGFGTGDFPNPETLIRDSISFYLGDFLRSGRQYPFRYDVFSELFKDSSGIFQVELDLPCGFSWTNNPMIFDGQAPIRTDITSTGGGRTRVTLDYQLPFSDDHVFSFFNLEFNCLDQCLPPLDLRGVIPISSCGDGVFPPDITEPGIVDSLGRFPVGVIDDFEVKIKSAYIPANGPQSCGIADCEEFNMHYVCGDSADLFTYAVPGYVDYDAQFFRENLGLQDDDDNREPDSNNPPSLDKIRRDRFIPGDTASTKIQGRVITDIDGYTARRLRFHIDFEGHTIDNGIDGGVAPIISGTPRDSRLFRQLSGIRDLTAQLAIFDASTGETYTCEVTPTTVLEDLYGRLYIVNTRPPDIFNEIRRLSYIYEINLNNAQGNNCDIPPGFILEEDDVIQLDAKHLMIFNSINRVLNMRQYTSVYMYNEPTDPEANFTCGRPGSFFQLAGYNYNRILGNFVAEPCKEFSESVGSGFNIALAMTNFFPFEVRNLAKVVDWDIILGTGFSLTETRLVNAGHDGMPSRHTDVLLQGVKRGSTYEYDLSQFQDPPYDEGFYINLFHKFKSEPIACSFEDKTLVALHSRVEFDHNFPDLPDFFDDTQESSLGIRPLFPRLITKSDDPVFIGYGTSADWDFTLENASDYLSENTWLYISPSDNRIFDFKLTNNSGQLLTPDNGIYQLGTFDPRDLKDFSLSANYNVCGIDTVQIIYGWNCAPINSPSEFACNRDTFNLILEVPKGELEMDIESSTDSVQLCDTVPFHIIEVFNADLGTAFGLNLKALLPPGISIIPGTSEIAYTTASGNFITVPDPQDNGAGNYEWDISAIQSVIGSNGLIGVQNDPQHSVSLRFLGLTECGLIASAPIIFNISGTASCGDPINTLSKPSEEINVLGVTADYETQISPTADTEVACGGLFELALSVRVLGMTQQGDSIFITLPEGITYVAGSYSAVNNAVFDEPNVQTRGNFTVLKWKIQEGLTSGSRIAFKLTIGGFGNENCSDVPIQVQTIQSREALCITTNELCPVLVQSGFSQIKVDVLNPDIRIDEFEATVGSSGVDYILGADNIGSGTDAPVSVDFYLDSDGNGFLSPGDQFLDTQVFTDGVLQGDRIRLTGNLNVSEDEICRIIAVIDPDKNCTCELEQMIIRAAQKVHSELSVCSEEIIRIGLTPENGHIYSWDNPVYISCTNCPQPDFTFQNVGLDTVVFNYILTDDNGICPVENLIKIIVYPEPRILQDDQEICEGEIVELTATTADSYNWTGAGITNPDNQNQTVAPSQSGFYIVEIINDINCSKTDSVFIDVTPAPIADAGTDTTLCEHVTGFQLEAYSEPGYSFIWQPVHLLSDIFSHNPTITPNQTSVFYLTVTDDRTGCSVIDSVFVAFSEAPELSATPDQSICKGDSIILRVNGAETYIWDQAQSLDCRGDATCQSAVAKPEVTTNYVITGFNAGECESKDSILITVAGENHLIETDSFFCEGDTAIIFGEEYFSDTIVIQENTTQLHGCDSTIIVNLYFESNERMIDTSFCAGDTIILFGEQLISFDTADVCDYVETPNGSCKRIQVCYNVTENSLPDISLVTIDTFIIEIGSSIDLTLPAGFSSYLWTSTDSLLNCDTCQITTVSPQVTTDYSGYFFNESGCSVSSRFHIKVVNECNPDNMEIPNIFSPNGDMLNDIFKPFSKEEGVEVISSIKVFNRWGELVYEGTGPNAGWDGNYNEKEAPSDVYIYKVGIECSSGPFEKTGDVTLYR